VLNGKRYCAVLNPAAGGGKCGKLARPAIRRLAAFGFNIDVHETREAGDGSAIVKKAYAEGTRHFLAIGGDGTSFEVVNGLFPRPAGDSDPVVLAFLPLGTGNSFLRDFRIEDPESAIAAFVQQKEHPVDVIRAEHAGGAIHFINILSLGFSARVGALTNARFKRYGRLGYVMAIVGSVASLEHPVFPIRIDGGDWDRRPVTFLTFSNSRYTGGRMMMAPNAQLSDGKMDVVRIHPVSRGKLLRSVPKIFEGTHVEAPLGEEALAGTVELDSGETDVMIDGEVVNIALKKLVVLPRALTVIG
jgi:YegS/Rv2252/BmrU family lipid kinase